MATAGRSQDLEVVGVRGDDVVAVVGQEDDGGVDDVGAPSGAKQLAGRAPEKLVERTHVDSGKSSCQPSLGRPSLAERSEPRRPNGHRRI